MAVLEFSLEKSFENFVEDGAEYAYEVFNENPNEGVLLLTQSVIK